MILSVTTAWDRVRPLVEEGRSREGVIAAKPTADLDALRARDGSFTQPDLWVGLVFDGMVKGGPVR